MYNIVWTESKALWALEAKRGYVVVIHSAGEHPQFGTLHVGDDVTRWSLVEILDHFPLRFFLPGVRFTQLTVNFTNSSESRKGFQNCQYNLD